MDLKIPFRGLEEGKHEYEFSIDDKFFENFPEGEVKEGRLTAFVELIKRSTGMESTFNISGKVKVPCDRCLEEYLENIEYSGKLFFQYGEETHEISDELIVLSGSEDYLDMAEYINEFIHLSLPFQKSHPDDPDGNTLCDQGLMDRLNELSGNTNTDEIEDPRWDKLRDLIN